MTHDVFHMFHAIGIYWNYMAPWKFLRRPSISAFLATVATAGGYGWIGETWMKLPAKICETGETFLEVQRPSTKIAFHQRLKNNKK